MWKVLKFDSSSGAVAHRPVFLLSREARESHLAEKLGGLLDRVFVFASFEDLTARVVQKRSPVAIAIDLADMKAPYEEKLTELRARYPDAALLLLVTADMLAHACKLAEEGIADYLIKPVTAEKLAWILKHIHQTDFNDEISERSIAQAFGHLSACLSAAHIRRTLLASLRHLVHAQGAVWLSPRKGQADKNADFVAREGFIPDHSLSSMIIEGVPFYLTDPVFHEKVEETGVYDLVLPTGGSDGSSICLWRVGRRISPRILSIAGVLLEHAQTCLMHLTKVEDATQQAFVDDLTGLYNARYLNFALRTAEKQSRGRRFSVLFIDVDHFKAINDTHGHLVGSAFLKTIGKTIQTSIRKEQDIFRYGGDEFVVLLRNAGPKTAKRVAERIRRAVDEKGFVIKGKHIHATVSIGLATFPDHASENETLMRLADEAMYHAKAASRNAVHLAFGLHREARPAHAHKKH